jgi:predicted small lipoprotein YifL
MLLLLAGLLPACGQYGDLYLPEEPAAESQADQTEQQNEEQDIEQQDELEIKQPDEL